MRAPGADVFPFQRPGVARRLHTAHPANDVHEKVAAARETPLECFSFHKYQSRRGVIEVGRNARIRVT